MTFQEWLNSPDAIGKGLLQCWNAAQEAMRERAANVADKSGMTFCPGDGGICLHKNRVHMPSCHNYDAAAIRALPVE